jgi:hypothetical protein
MTVENVQFGRVVQAIVIILVIISFYHDYHEDKILDAEQKIFLAEVHHLGSSTIVRLEVASGHRRKGRTNILAPHDIQRVQAFLKHADPHYLSGYRQAIWDCMITVTLEEETVLQFLGTVYEEHPLDLFLTDNLYIKREDGSYTRRAKRPVRVKGLGEWLLDYRSKNPGTKGGS